MSNIQYTIRSISPVTDKALRSRARKKGVSLNRLIVDLLEKSSGTQSTESNYTDLNHLFGVGLQDTDSFDRAMKHIDEAPLESDLKL